LTKKRTKTRIRKERESQDLTQTEMSQITGIERSRYKRIEDGARLYFDEAKLICDALGKEFQWLNEGAEMSDLKGEDLDTVKRYREFPREWRDHANAAIQFLYNLWKRISNTPKE